jgi:predicted transposase/invertase (TIGR01784 family)
MTKRFSLTDDFMFKNIFADVENLKDFLSDILIGPNSLLPTDAEIKVVEFTPTEYFQQRPPELAKKVYFDLQVTTTHGIFIVEVQKQGSDDYLRRGEFYSAMTYSSQKIKGTNENSMKGYSSALPVILISIIGDKIFGADIPCLSYHITLEKETMRHVVGGISYVFIELAKFDNPKYSQKNITVKAKEWLHFFKENAINDNYSNPRINKAIEYVNYIIDNKYLEYVRDLISEQAIINEKEEAQRKGREEGMQEGLEQGIEQGIAKGIETSKLEIVRKMLCKKQDPKDIVDIVGLSIEEIEAIRCSMDIDLSNS